MATACTEPKAPNNGQLDNLSLELVEAICSHGLSLRDRVALASCCRALWALQELAASTAVWGSLVIRPRYVATPDKRAGLLAWLTRHHAGLRRVQLEGHGVAGPVLALLGKLPPGTPLVDLQMAGQLAPIDGRRPSVLRPLQHLGQLATLNLRDNNLRHLPRHLASSRLTSLDLSHNALQPSALGVLQHMTTLHCLKLSCCGLVELPPELTALSGCLLELTANGNDFVMEDEQEVELQPFEPLLALTRLRHLALSECAPLRTLPSELAALAALESLDVGQSLEQMMEASSDLDTSFAQAAALRPLHQLGRLTRLDLSECELRSMHFLASLPRLAVLNCRSNWLLGHADFRTAFRPLQQATALTRLVLGGCNLCQLPRELAALGGSLAQLELGPNNLGGEGALAPLSRLTLLTHLDLGSCKLTVLPADVVALTLLQSLELGSNEFEDGGDSLCLLSNLAVLTHLSISWCLLPRLPPEVSALRLLSDLDASGNRLDGTDAMQPLRHVSTLTRLFLGHCQLGRLPSELAALPALVDLAVSRNPLGSGGDGAWQPLLPLQRLTRLDARGCGLQQLPPQLSALLQLQELRLSMNEQLGAASAAPGFLQPLQGLTSLRGLWLSECGLRGLGASAPAAGEVPQLAQALRSLEVLSCSGNPQLGQRAAEVLELAALLPSLSHLDLGGCQVQGCQQELAAVASRGVTLRL